MLCGVYEENGICVRNHCGAEPPRDTEPPGLVTTVGGRDRASASYAAADRVKAPASAARGRFRGVHGGRTAASLPAEARTTSGGGCLAGSVPSVLVRSRRCSRTPPRPHGSTNTNEKEDKEKKMTLRELYAPGPASGAQVRKDGEKWTLILVRELRHSPEKVWQALTDPAHLREWAPFDVDGSLGTVGTTVKLTTVGTPTPQVSETTVTRADAPKVLEYNWGDKDIRWELEAFGGGTRLMLWHNIDRRFISMGAAGWHICFDVLDRLLSGTPIGRIVAGEAMKFGWPRLNAEYAQQFGINPHLRKQAQEYEEAREVQQGLMPKQIPQIPGVEISGSWRPARIVGGDYFDVFDFSERRVGLCIADVSGKGMPAALLMSNLQAVVTALASEDISPNELVEKVNRVMCRNTT